AGDAQQIKNALPDFRVTWLLHQRMSQQLAGFAQTTGPTPVPREEERGPRVPPRVLGGLPQARLGQTFILKAERCLARAKEPLETSVVDLEQTIPGRQRVRNSSLGLVGLCQEADRLGIIGNGLQRAARKPDRLLVKPGPSQGLHNTDVRLAIRRFQSQQAA